MLTNSISRLVYAFPIPCPCPCIFFTCYKHIAGVNTDLFLQCPRKNFCKRLFHRHPFRCRAAFPEIDKDAALSFVKASKTLAICYALTATTLFSQVCLNPIYAVQTVPATPDISLLMSGQPIKDPEALLRYALPIDNKQIRGIQKNLENINENLKLPNAQAFNSAKKNLEQAMTVLKKYKKEILDDIDDPKTQEGSELIDRLMAGLLELKSILSSKDKGAIMSLQKKLLTIINCVEEDMVDNFPFTLPEPYADKPLLKGRATVEMKIKTQNNPEVENVTFLLVVDGYNAPVTSGNFVDLVVRHFYDGMAIQRADGFLVQTGDPEGPADGFVDPGTGKKRTVPLEITASGGRSPIYGKTLQEDNRNQAQTKLPCNAKGTMAMARNDMETDSASSQIFWLVREVPPSPERFAALDGRYSVFGYVVENQNLLSKLQAGDVIESMRVVSGLQNLVNPTYKIT